MRNVRMRWLSTLALILTAQLPSQVVLGGVTRDGTIGPGPQAQITSGPGCDYCVLESLGARSGTNLYHSFSEFNVGMGETASFFGSAYSSRPKITALSVDIGIVSG